MRNLLVLAIIIVLSSCKSKTIIPEGDTYEIEIKKHREDYKQEFLQDERSPLREADFEYMNFYPADIAYKCDCAFVYTPNAVPFEMSTVSGNTKIFTKHGVASCNIGGEQTNVNIYQSKETQAIPGYRDYLFIPFKDMTNGESTYGMAPSSSTSTNATIHGVCIVTGTTALSRHSKIISKSLSKRER
jgi:hypothetical protein